MDGNLTYRPVPGAALMPRMAERAGVDLDEAVLRGELSPAEMAEAEVRCTGCGQTEACRTTLEVPGSDVPDYCRNRGLFAELVALKGAG